MKCPHCSLEFDPPKGVRLGVVAGGIESPDQERSVRSSNPEVSLLSEPRPRVRGPGKQYSGPFEAAWKQYGRKQEKSESYFRWCIVAPSVGGEENLLRLCLAAFTWQAKEWGPEGWQYAPYFHRYLKRRKWEDEPRPAAVIRPASNYCDFHRGNYQRNGRLPPTGPVVGCPECKHAQSAVGTRRSEPTDLGELPGWAGRNATAEELASLKKGTA